MTRFILASEKYTINSGHMTIGIIVKTKHFALNFFVKQNRTTSIILILKVASKKGRLIRVLFW